MYLVCISCVCEISTVYFCWKVLGRLRDAFSAITVLTFFHSYQKAQLCC